MTFDGATIAADITAASDKVKPMPSAFTKSRMMPVPWILTRYQDVNVTELQITVDAVKT